MKKAPSHPFCRKKPPSEPLSKPCISNPTCTDTMTYLLTLKSTLSEEYYSDFLALLTDFEAKRVGVCYTLSKVRELLKGQDVKLRDGFKVFLPNDDCTIVSPYGFHNWLSAIEGSVDFLNRLSRTFAEDGGQTCRLFFDIMNRYETEHRDVKRLCREVDTLFQGEPGLCIEFTKFFGEEDML